MTHLEVTTLRSYSPMESPLPTKTYLPQPKSNNLRGQTQRVPTAFLLLLPDGKLHIFLQIARFDTRMGLPATQWDNNLYVQKGGLYHNQAQLVTWDSTYFRQANASLRVQTPAAIDNSFAGDPAAVFLGPHDAADADTEVIRYRKTCYVPPA